MRVLITGSRDWHDYDAIYEALADLDNPKQWTVIHGGAQGADTIAGRVGIVLGMNVEIYKANWTKHLKAAGHIRNQQMVDTGADLCLAFPLSGSKGTWDCMKRAESAGIPVQIPQALDQTPSDG